MKERVKLWDSELRDNVYDNEFLEIYAMDINYTKSQYEWYGLNYVVLIENKMINDEIYYTIEEEQVSEIVQEHKSTSIIKDTLLNDHETGDFEVKAVFTDKDEAYAYLEENYPKKDLEQLINETIFTKFTIDFHTGIQDEIYVKDLDEAKLTAEERIAYTQENITILGEDGEVLAMARWFGVDPEEDDENVLQEIGEGHYQRWDDEL